MAQQKGKKNSSPWSQCESCGTNLINKDIELHSKDCPPEQNQQNYDFIKDNILYGTVDVKTNEEIKNLASSEKDFLVFLSQSAIQLTNLSIGDWCKVEGGPVSIAKIVWPTTEKTLTSILFTRNSYDLNFSGVKHASVSKLDSNLKPASLVTVILLNGPKALEINPDLINRISKNFIGKILKTENKVNLMYFGKILKFQIKSIEARQQDDLIESFNKLQLKESEFFTIDEKTKWKMYKDHDEFIKVEIKPNLIHQLAGLSDELTEIRDIIKVYFGSKSGPKYCRSVLLYGHSGTGKTLLANAIAEESKFNKVEICAPDLYSKHSGNIEDSIKNLFQSAVSQSPSIIVLDEIDVLCPSRTARITDTEKRIVSTLLMMFDFLNENPNSKVFLIATTNKVDNIDPAFRRFGRLDRELEIATPNPKNRKEILEKILEDYSRNLSEDELKDIALNTHGFVGADLVSLCSRASLSASKRNDDCVTFDDFKFALTRVRPSAMREVQIEVPNVKWNDIGGQDKLKLILRQAVEWPLKHADSFKRLGVTPPKGVLMYGPPGCSKTMIAKALATESGLNFLSIKGPELFSKWVGESERAVREVFRKARQVAPCIIFFDEIDALGGERSSGSSTSVQERVLAQLLTELDGVTPLGDVTVIAATNRPDRIDKALLRPGRLDRIVYVPLPSEDTRREIFRIKLAKMPVRDDVILDELVQSTQGYSGAEVNAVCHEAAMMALEESLDIEYVEKKHFEKALELIKPRTPPSLIKLYDDYAKLKL